MTEIDISVDFIGLHFKNPFLTAASLRTTRPDQIPKFAKKIAEGSWSGVVMKSIIPEQFRDEPSAARGIPLSPCFWGTRGKLHRLGMVNAGPGMPSFSAEDLTKAVKALKKENLIAIASVYARPSFTPDEWSNLAKKVAECGPDAIELDTSCPVMVAESQQLGERSLENVCRSVNKTINLPFIAKLSPNTSDIAEMAKGVEKGGADALSAINTVLGITGVDVETGIPYPCDMAHNVLANNGLSGPIIKPMGLRAVALCAQAVKIPISAIGGIDDWESAVEYTLLGATTLQSATGTMWYGFDLAQRMTNGLRKYMERKGYGRIADFRGSSLRYFTGKRDWSVRGISVIDHTKCKRCGICVTACNDAAFQAMSLKNNQVLVDPGKCQGCGLCTVVCPIPNCVNLKLRSN